MLICTVAFFVVYGSIEAFIELTQNIQSDILKEFDDTFTDIIQSYRSENLTSFFTIITDIGDVWGYCVAVVIATIVFFYFIKNWKYALQLLCILLLAIGSNILLKQIINRQRPLAEHLVSVKTLSYPSGHAMTAMAFYGFLIYLTLSFKIKGYLKIFLILIFTFLILSIGVSRVYLGVHYPSDVVGGFIAGFAWIIFSILILTIIKIYRKRHKTE